jgi:hypothetical protein
MSWTEPVKGSCDANLPDCLSPSIRDPWETDYAAVMPRFSGSLSAISSAAIIYVILRSEKGLSGIYHRIMFGMSTADILGSLAMALTSLPMPSYMFKEEEFGYHSLGRNSVGKHLHLQCSGLFCYVWCIHHVCLQCNPMYLLYLFYCIQYETTEHSEIRGAHYSWSSHIGWSNICCPPAHP